MAMNVPRMRTANKRAISELPETERKWPGRESIDSAECGEWNGGGLGGWVVRSPAKRRLNRSGGFVGDLVKTTTKMGATWIEVSDLTRRADWWWWRPAGRRNDVGIEERS
ncbi:hypothetical protein Salat_0727100 [Sesamum alatum]|uniref:Uncharacterized protein n=1 Tax=Sesamum alatum TaxID=300844 RepID=A0AAE2CV14_9LAMI|nr:hypothetical protein Salat_0727100 [Sesamum alatum]